MNVASPNNQLVSRPAGPITAASPIVAKAPSGSPRQACKVEEKNVQQTPPRNLPAAYQRGCQDFYGRDFLVTPDVLIPRPETEQLIDEILTLAGKPYLPGLKPPISILPPSPQILDVGTGSGCIAVTLKLKIPEAKIFASDISPAAIKIAQKNAAKYGTPITFIISHLLEKVNFTPDVIAANLPYVDSSWEWLDCEALSYEPATALYAKNHGLALIFELIKVAGERRISYLVLEADPCQHSAITTYAAAHHYALQNTRGYILTLRYTEQANS